MSVLWPTYKSIERHLKTEMVQWVEALVTRLDSLSSVPGVYLVGERLNCYRLSPGFYTLVLENGGCSPQNIKSSKTARVIKSV